MKNFCRESLRLKFPPFSVKLLCGKDPGQVPGPRGPRPVAVFSTTTASLRSKAVTSGLITNNPHPAEP